MIGLVKILKTADVLQMRNEGPYGCTIVHCFSQSMWICCYSRGSFGIVSKYVLYPAHTSDISTSSILSTHHPSHQCFFQRLHHSQHARNIIPFLFMLRMTHACNPSTIWLCISQPGETEYIELLRQVDRASTIAPVTVAGMLPRDKLSLSRWEVVSAPANQPGTQRE